MRRSASTGGCGCRRSGAATGTEAPACASVAPRVHFFAVCEHVFFTCRSSQHVDAPAFAADQARFEHQRKRALVRFGVRQEKLMRDDHSLGRCGKPRQAAGLNPVARDASATLGRAAHRKHHKAKTPPTMPSKGKPNAQKINANASLSATRCASLPCTLWPTRRATTDTTAGPIIALPRAMERQREAETVPALSAGRPRLNPHGHHRTRAMLLACSGLGVW
jgi:hypothetical protein